MNVIDVIYERMGNHEPSVIVTVLSGARQGDKVVYSETGDILYGTAIEGFTMPERIQPQLFSIAQMECFLNL